MPDKGPWTDDTKLIIEVLAMESKKIIETTRWFISDCHQV